MTRPAALSADAVDLSQRRLGDFIGPAPHRYAIPPQVFQPLRNSMAFFVLYT